MSGFAAQLKAAKNAHDATSALEDSVRAQISTAFDDWDAGKISATSVRHKLENIVRTAYRTSASVAAAHAVKESGLPEWVPSERVFLTPYLSSLLEDVRNNLREFKKSDQGDVERRRAIQRIQHSAGVAAQRGYTDALITSYGELESMGYSVRKVWVANFNGTLPCEHCRGLHGTEVPLRQAFPVPTQTKLKVYRDLQGPPRHPRCRCYLAILIINLENVFDDLDLGEPEQDSPTSMTTDDVKKMPAKIFAAVVKVLKKIISFVRGK
jgi:hypothetical protein